MVASIVTKATTIDSATEPPDEDSHSVSLVFDPLAVPEAIQSIRQRVSEHFYMREMRDPELTASTIRRAYVLPRQLAMYIARQLTGASLPDIGREFDGRHHSTVLHSINKIEMMRRSDEALNCTITRLVDAVVAQN